ncbi:MAG: phenylalanine--tRNA ligase subunit beta [Rikenellaceae bacterium]
MKVSYKWLKNYLPVELEPEKMAEILTTIGLEVEALEKIETIKGGLEGLVIGEVLTCEKHPDADKLNITTVEYGQGPTQIVCGAPNVAKGQKVVVATVGATLYPTNSDESFKIKKSKIRGVESLGMLCAEDEIGVGNSHDGIIELPEGSPVGTQLRDFYKIEDDYTFEIGLTPNRIDAASHIGVARDIAAYLTYQNSDKCAVKLPDVSSFALDAPARHIKVEVENSVDAPRYMGLTICGVEVKPSPEWLQNSLRSIGLNPKNNIVDITNFILHELGQPLHAFDADKIDGDTVVVRSAVEGEKFVTLDGVERSLSSEDLMICSQTKPMCLAGVFGGADSGVSDSTKNVFLESAYFNPVSIRKSAKRHSLSTDASFRYERGTDPNIPHYALMRAALLIKELSGGEFTSGVIDVLNYDLSGTKIELSINRIESLIGKKIGKDTITSILEGLDIKILCDNGDLLEVEVPLYRVDVKREVDVIEDILRIYGYDNIEIPQAVHSTLSYEPKYSLTSITETISQLLSSSGFNEIMSNSLTKGEYYENSEIYPINSCVKILNPLSVDLNVMRRTLLYNSLEALMLNTNRRRSNVKLYEFGNCYEYVESAKEQGGLSPYKESSRLALLISGDITPASWMSAAQKSSLFSLKHYAELILKRLGLDFKTGVLEPIKNEIYKEGATLVLRNKNLLEFGVLTKKLCDKFDVKGEVYFMELDVNLLLSMASTVKTSVKELSKYPEVKRDLALLVDKNVSFAQLRAVALKCEKKLLKSVSLFDVYEGDKLPEGKKSYALNFVLEDTTKTLNDAIIDKTMNNLIAQFEKQCAAQVRKS